MRLRTKITLNYAITGAAIVSVVAAAAACVLVLAGTGDNIFLRVSAWTFYGVAAAAAAWLGWYCLTLVKIIEATVTSIEKGREAHLKAVSNKLFNNLIDAVNSRSDGNISYIKQSGKQIKDNEIKIQILRREKRNSDAIIYSIRDAVLVIDEFDRVLMANEAAGKICGFDFKKATLEPIDKLIRDDKTKLIDFLRQSRQSRIKHSRREIEFSCGGSIRTFNCIVSCVYDTSDNVCGVVAVLHDITREKEISQAKNDFISHVSHELKTPLASILAYSEMLSDGEAKDEKTKQEFCSVIQNQAQRLNRLIDDILNISRIESGLMKVEKKPVSLAMLIDEQVHMIKSYADEKNITVSLGDGDTDTSDLIVFGQVYADKDMISQVIVNLLSNAVKYTKKGGSVKVETEVDENAGLARVSVTDTGVGIPEDEVEHVFDKFYRVKKNNKQAKGTGLGLNLVKKIVEDVHGGKVFVTSQVGRGSTLGFELPLATAEVAG